MPAPRGKGLCIEKECAKILEMAGIKDIWSKTKGQTKTKLNMISALMDALRKLSEQKVRPIDVENLGVVEGKLKGSDREEIAPVVEGSTETAIEPVAEATAEEIKIES